MEISFQKVRLEHRELIEEHLDKKCGRGCESVFANLYLWNRRYNILFAMVEDTLVCCSPQRRKELSFSFPAGEPHAVKKAVEQLGLYCKEKGVPLRFYLVLPCEYAMLEEFFPGRFEIEYDRDNADYIYEREKLATLAGKKLHGKRNHINKFKSLYPNWSYETITKENVEDCFQMAMVWRRDHDGETDEEIRNEIAVTMNALRLMDELSLRGGLIRVEGEVVAFTIGEVLTKETFVVHVEKAFSDIQGAYPMVNQQFVIHEMEEFLYVNREEDTGSEGLRKAKLSYRPSFLLEKGTVVEKIS